MVFYYSATILILIFLYVTNLIKRITHVCDLNLISIKLRLIYSFSVILVVKHTISDKPIMENS